MKLLGSTKNKITKDENGENPSWNYYSEYDEIIAWFTDQNSQPLETEDRINLTMVIK